MRRGDATRRRRSTATRHSPPPRRHSPSLRVSGAGCEPFSAPPVRRRSSASTRLLQNGKSRIAGKSRPVSRRCGLFQAGRVFSWKQRAYVRPSDDFRSFSSKETFPEGPGDTRIFFKANYSRFSLTFYARGFRACRARKEVARLTNVLQLQCVVCCCHLLYSRLVSRA